MPPDKRSGPSATKRPPQVVPPGTVAILPDQADAHCPRCSCRCRCHRPPPEPPYVPVPPRPGSWEWSGYLAELSVELGSLEAAYAAVDPRVVVA
jgi:hypothetical protein